MNYYPLDHEVTIKDLNQFTFANQKIGVIAHIENSNGLILLQQRGKKAYDEKGLYEYIGGKVEDNDLNFKAAIMREIKEEAGDELNLEIADSLGIFHCLKNNINWLFVIYFGKYIDGNIKIMELDKCMGYRFFSYNDAINSRLVTESCKYILKSRLMLIIFDFSTLKFEF